MIGMEEEKTVKIIFNPHSGSNKESPEQLEKVIKELQKLHYKPEVYLIEKGKDFSDMINRSISSGIKIFAACGGDGTISAVAKNLAGKNAALAVIPTGTQNNIARSLGIPEKIPEAVALLQNGCRYRIDMCALSCCNCVIPFLEVCSIGLFSAIYPACDELQHGNLTKIGNFFSGFSSLAQSKIQIVLDKENEITLEGHLILVSNMPYIMRHFQVGDKNAFRDGLMDILIFDDISKADLARYAITGPKSKNTEDSRIHHFQAKQADIYTTPEMPILADGNLIGKDKNIHLEIRSQFLSAILPISNDENYILSGDKI